MKVIVDRIEENIVIVEADDENTYKLSSALCPDAREGDTLEINVIGKQLSKEEPHTIFERLRKNSNRKKDMKKAVKSGSSPEDDTVEKNAETPD
ncbi:DUF3006 domain-containing protein [Ruminococcus difficilis]|uniref:DUF3006 domain-containing protein n=1 Tax=Ruminococcus difficilis TaxID=2763069 RepID=A0A934U2I6_9FIRM|nr:DUF3006 domain-containing protein [Ruminococcus difficilis]MBK6088274.1 DUF3006 domain-containing protein [Ruminococcus difficilis]